MRKFLRAAALSATFALSAAQAGAETLADAMISAYKNSHLLDQNQAVLRAADEDVAIAISALRPVISFAATAGYAYSRTELAGTAAEAVTEGLSASVELSATLMLLDFGRREFGIRMAEHSVLATRHALVNVEQQVLLAAVSAYVNVQLTQQIVALRESNVNLISQELGAARDRFEVGEVTLTDVSIAEARLAAAKSALSAAQGDLSVAREAYKAATGHYPGKLAALPAAPKIGKSLEEAQAVARRSHPLVLQAQELVAVSEAQAGLADANMKPTVGASASVELSDGLSNDGNTTTSLGLSLNQTIYAGGQYSAQYRKALAGADQSRANLGQTVVTVLQNVGNAWSAVSVYGASIEASRQQVEAAQAAFNGVREEASLGARTTLDVLNAEQELLDARASRLQAEASRYIAVYQVLSAMGILTAEHLKLGVPTYDPEAYYKAVRNAPATSSRGKKLDEILEKIGN